MRIRAGHVAVEEGWALAGTNVVDGAMQGGKAGDDIGAVELVEMEIREAGDEPGDVAAGGLGFDGDGDGVVVVLHADQEREFHEGRGVHGFPELTLAGGAVAEGDVDDFVAVEGYVLEFAIVAVGFAGGVGKVPEVASGFGAAYGLEDLGSSAGGLRNDVEVFEGPVGGHLASTGAGIIGCAYGSEEHFVGRAAQGEAESAVAIVRIEPVVGGLESEAGGDAEGFVASPGNLKKDLLLALEEDFAVVDAARHVHEAVGVDELLRSQALVGFLLDRGGLAGSLFNLGLNLRSGHSTSPYDAL